MKYTDIDFDKIKKIVSTYDIDTISGLIYRNKEYLTEEQIGVINEILIDRKILRTVKGGLRAFEIDGKMVIAMNKENAERKIIGKKKKKVKNVYSNDYSRLRKIKLEHKRMNSNQHMVNRMLCYIQNIINNK